MNQETALAILKSGKNVFLTGSAGAGKTFVLNEYIRYLKDRKVTVAVTASTGIAATHMNGMTIHSWSGIGVKNTITSRDLANMKTKKYLRENLEKVSVLIIDEISMLHKSQMEMVNTVLKFFKSSGLGFGGIQVVFSGDFFQLPPIGRPGETNRDKFAFMAQAWLEAKLEICYLTEQYRQTDNELNSILNQIRNGTVSEYVIQQLQKADLNELTADSNITELYTHNVDVDQINKKQLSQLSGKAKLFKATLKGNKKLLETMKKSVLTEVELELKPDTRVMFIKNNYEKGFMNGTLGKVIGFTEKGFPNVKTFDGKVIEAEPEKWMVEDDSGKTLASFSQVPLRHAWAITVHKSQGMTLDAAKMDLSKTFERGQGYVALSRLKDMEGLQLTGFNEIALEVDSLVMKADLRFRQLCKEDWDINELEGKANNFIKKCGGLTDPEEIEKNKRKKKEKKSKKEKGLSTYQITAEYIPQGFSLEEIANHRGLSKSTVITHLVKLNEIYPEIDLSAYKPKEDQLEKVRTAQKKLLKKGKVGADGTVSLGAMFNELDYKLSYEEIKLTLVFIAKK